MTDLCNCDGQEMVDGFNMKIPDSGSDAVGGAWGSSEGRCTRRVTGEE